MILRWRLSVVFSSEHNAVVTLAGNSYSYGQSIAVRLNRTKSSASSAGGATAPDCTSASSACEMRQTCVRQQWKASAAAAQNGSSSSPR